MRRLALASLAGIVLLAACGSDDETTTETTAAPATTAAPETSAAPETTAAAGSAAAECAAGKTVGDGVLTIATGEPAFPPYVIDDAPESGQGFEAAVALAVARELGFEGDAVAWIRTPFDTVIGPGLKDFDFNLQQYTITEERKKTVSFSDPYYVTNQAVVGLADSAAAGAKSIADLKGVKFGAQASTTSLDFINEVIQPDTEPFVYEDNAGAKAALEAKQIDAIVVDLPTAFYIAAVEIEGASVIGQFPATSGDEFGLLFDLDNPLVSCVNEALAGLTSDGTLAGIVQTWLADKTNAPVIAG